MAVNMCSSYLLPYNKASLNLVTSNSNVCGFFFMNLQFGLGLVRRAHLRSTWCHVQWLEGCSLFTAIAEVAFVCQLGP